MKHRKVPFRVLTALCDLAFISLTAKCILVLVALFTKEYTPQTLERINLLVQLAESMGYSIVFCSLSILLRKAMEQRPFQGQNIQIIYFIAFVFFAFGAILVFIKIAYKETLDVVTVYPGFIVHTLATHVDHFFMGLFAICLAYIFKEGSRLAHENHLTI
ncbi:MAG: hypothetical protein AAFW89_06070 [Bacteroidota bacterium]